MTLASRVSAALAEKPDETQLDKYLSDLRDSLSSSNKLFINLPLLATGALLVYVLVALQGASGLTFNSVQVTDVSLVRRVFLVVPAGLLGAAACVGYLRRYQRAVYDVLLVARCRPLAAHGLHEFRLPADHILGLFVLQLEGGTTGKILATVTAFLAMVAFFLGPAVFIISASVDNLRHFGSGDPLAVCSAAVSIGLALCSLLVIVLSSRAKVA